MGIDSRGANNNYTHLTWNLLCAGERRVERPALCRGSVVRRAGRLAGRLGGRCAERRAKRRAESRRASCGVSCIVRRVHLMFL